MICLIMTAVVGNRKLTKAPFSWLSSSFHLLSFQWERRLGTVAAKPFCWGTTERNFFFPKQNQKPTKPCQGVISGLDTTVLRQRSNSEVEQEGGKLSCEEQWGFKKKKGEGREENKGGNQLSSVTRLREPKVELALPHSLCLLYSPGRRKYWRPR